MGRMDSPPRRSRRVARGCSGRIWPRNPAGGRHLRGATLLGVVALHNINSQRGSAAIDYCMDSRYRGEGIVTKACRALVSYAFAEGGLNRIQICADTVNLPSLRVPEKLGFTKEGVLRSYYRSASGFRDCVLFSMLKDEWDPGRG